MQLIRIKRLNWFVNVHFSVFLFSMIKLGMARDLKQDVLKQFKSVFYFFKTWIDMIIKLK